MRGTDRWLRPDDEQAGLLSALAAGLAHEIRNPLSTLQVNLQLLKEDWLNPSTPRETRALKKVETILRETRRLEDILNDFLRFAAHHEIVLADCDLHQVLDEILDFLTPEWTRLGIGLTRDYDRKLPLVGLDRNLFRQAVLNLLINARQVLASGGRVVVRTRREGDRARIDIADDGPGIKPEDLPHIFKVFFSTKKGGTGLGLPTARRIVAEHDGTLAVDSEPGRGSTFTIRLPLAPSEGA
ncbi:MAG: two-component sensor histidine kinase [Planctomycetes bacterium]|nr:two-component sensor histidine kinase [Planctomycetota bacterium]